MADDSSRSIFLVAAALRQMQPAQFGPSHTSWVIFNWAVSHVTHTDAAVIFLALPAAVLLVGCVALLRSWGDNQTFRRDAAEAFAILGRNFSLCLIIVATGLGGTILAAVIAHLIIG